LLPTLVGLLERGSAVLRGKALLTLALLFRLHPRWLLAACQTKLLPLIDRLQKDKEPYLERCLEACVGVVVALAPKVNEAVLSEIDRLTGSTASAAGRPGSAGGWGWGGDGGGGTRPGSRGGSNLHAARRRAE
jgi:serine/threonine-protein kinase ULK4